MSLPPHFSHILNLTVKFEVRGDLFRGVMVSKEEIEIIKTVLLVLEYMAKKRLMETEEKEKATLQCVKGIYLYFSLSIFFFFLLLNVNIVI